MKKQFNKKGFTMIEIAISSSILAVIFGGITIFGVQTIKSFDRSRAIKNTIENASYTIEKLNKSIRTSHIIDGGGNRIFFIDNNTKKSYCYFFSGNKLKLRTGNDSATSCSDIGGSIYELVGNSKVEVTGSFSLRETSQSSDERGFVRTNIKLKYTANDNINDEEIIIQSSVSIRDYGLESP